MTLLEELRKKRRVTKKELALLLNVNRTTYSNYERNPEKMPLGSAIKVCKYLDGNFEDVFLTVEVDRSKQLKVEERQWIAQIQKENS